MSEVTVSLQQEDVEPYFEAYHCLGELMDKSEHKASHLECSSGLKVYITESVDSVCRDTMYTQYMLIQKNLSKSQKRYTYKPL